MFTSDVASKPEPVMVKVESVPAVGEVTAVTGGPAEAGAGGLAFRPVMSRVGSTEVALPELSRTDKGILVSPIPKSDSFVGSIEKLALPAAVGLTVLSKVAVLPFEAFSSSFATDVRLHPLASKLCAAAGFFEKSSGLGITERM